MPITLKPKAAPAATPVAEAPKKAGIVLKKVVPTATTTVEKIDSKAGTTTEVDKKVETVGPVKAFASVPAVISFGRTYTHNLGDYQSTRVSVELKMPSELDTVDEVADYVEGWVTDRLNAHVLELRGESAAE